MKRFIIVAKNVPVVPGKPVVETMFFKDYEYTFKEQMTLPKFSEFTAHFYKTKDEADQVCLDLLAHFLAQVNYQIDLSVKEVNIDI